jgi:FMN phosphatase YigB (HAD superfamily)
MPFRAVFFDIGGVLEITVRPGRLCPTRRLGRVLPGLRPRYRTAIFSNSFVGAREKERERYGFEDLTDLVVHSQEIGRFAPTRACTS